MKVYPLFYVILWDSFSSSLLKKLSLVQHFDLGYKKLLSDIMYMFKITKYHLQYFFHRDNTYCLKCITWKLSEIFLLDWAISFVVIYFYRFFEGNWFHYLWWKNGKKEVTLRNLCIVMKKKNKLCERRILIAYIQTDTDTWNVTLSRIKKRNSSCSVVLVLPTS